MYSGYDVDVDTVTANVRYSWDATRPTESAKIAFLVIERPLC